MWKIYIALLLLLIIRFAKGVLEGLTDQVINPDLYLSFSCSCLDNAIVEMGYD